MAAKEFAIPLDKDSKHSGDITFEALKNANTEAIFKITNITSGQTNQLNLITSKNGLGNNHIFSADISNGEAKTTLSASQINTVYSDASGGDWDYVEADWTIGAADTPSASVMYIVQSGNTYDRLNP
jgi:hypothetical protein